MTLGEAFDLGFSWAMELRGQTMEDSRAVGRTLLSDLFEPIHDHMNLEEFDSFQTADAGVVAGKRIIHDALKHLTTRDEALELARKYISGQHGKENLTAVNVLATINEALNPELRRMSE
jgi:hypothetical protein